MIKKYEEAEKDYIAGLSYEEIAEKYNVKLPTVKSWKIRYKWKRKDRTVKNIKNSVAHKIGKGFVENECLSIEEQNFCIYFANTSNATQSYLRAFDVNYRTANYNGYRLLALPKIKNEIMRIKEIIRKEMTIDVTIIDFLQYCMKVVGADIGQYVKFGTEEINFINETGEKESRKFSYLNFEDSERLDTSLIDEIKQGKNGASIKLADKKWAWEQLTKYFDWLPDKFKRDIEERKIKAIESSKGNAENALLKLDDVLDKIQNNL